jgi:hypothetical protein
MGREQIPLYMVMQAAASGLSLGKAAAQLGVSAAGLRHAVSRLGASPQTGEGAGARKNGFLSL